MRIRFGFSIVASIGCIFIASCNDQSSENGNQANSGWRCQYYTCEGSENGEPFGKQPTKILVPDVLNFIVGPGDSATNLSWQKPVSASHVRIIRKLGSPPNSLDDGTEVYRGTGDHYLDSQVQNFGKYFYKIFSCEGDISVSQGIVSAVIPRPKIITKWIKTTYDSSANNQFADIITDNAGDIIVVGRIYNSLPITYKSDLTVSAGAPGKWNSVIVKYDSLGTVKWAKTVTACSSESSYTSVATDNQRNIYVSGWQYGTAVCNYGNGISLSGPSNATNGIAAKYNAEGEAQWVKAATTAPGAYYFQSISVTNNGDLVVSGAQLGSGEYDYGNGVKISGPGANLGNPIILQFNNFGIATRALTVNNLSGNALFYAITVDAFDSMYVSGGYEKNAVIDFGNNVHISNPNAKGDTNAMVAKYDSSGAIVWATGITSSSENSFFLSIAVDTPNSIYASGTKYGNQPIAFTSGITIDGGMAGWDNGVLVKFDANGTALWAKTQQSVNVRSEFTKVLLDKNQNVIVAGYAAGSGSGNLGDGVSFTMIGQNKNPLLMRYHQDGTPLAGKSLSSGPDFLNAAGVFQSACINTSGSILAVGYQSGYGTFGFGDGTSITTPSQYQNSVLIKYD